MDLTFKLDETDNNISKTYLRNVSDWGKCYAEK